MATLTETKKYWYKNIFRIPWPKEQASDKDDDSKASLVVEDIGRIGDVKIHLTIFRDAWQYRFRSSLGTDEIFDRIFGSGTGGIHVTLETSPPIHCYRGGANEGRTAEEKKFLASLLSTWMTLYKDAIGKTKKDYTEFDWKGCDDASKRFEYLFSNVQEDGLSRLATMAGEICDAHVVYPGQMDSALVWSTAAIHPMQALQNTHQRQVKDACRELSGKARQEKESAELGQYYYFQAITPQQIGLPPNSPPTIQEDLGEAESSLKTLKWLINDASPDLDIKLIKKHLDIVHKKLKKLRSIFFSPPVRTGEGREEQSAYKKRKQEYASQVEAVTALFDVSNRLSRYYMGMKKLNTAPQLPQQPLTPTQQLDECGRLCGHLERAHHGLSRAFNGLCCVQNFHTIEPFYLFRLMVRFQIRSEKDIPDGLRTKVSSTLTALLHNSEHMDWLFTWLRDKLIELDALLKKTCPAKGPKSKKWPGGEPAFAFFLKGGRAAKYLANTPTKGENDWDTNIVINPTLRADDWYHTFTLVHNTVLVFLERSKREFLVNMHQAGHFNKFLLSLDEAQSSFDKEKKKATPTSIWNIFGLIPTIRKFITDLMEQTMDRQEDLAERSSPQPFGLELKEDRKESCKAELIDIGIPRRDTIEAFTGWFHVCPYIITRDRIPIPGHLYYIAEYVLMIREAFIGKSRSVHKTPKRVVRLLEVLEMADVKFDERIQEEEKQIPKESLSKSISQVKKQPGPLKRMLTILLSQFAIAYDLHIDADLAKCFDKMFSDNIKNMKAKANYPKELKDSVAAYKKEGNSYEKKHEDLADAIGYAQWVAQEIDGHLREERAKFIQEHRLKLTEFVKSIYTGTFFYQAQEQTFERYEVQFAVTGAFAAALHAENAGFERPEELEAVRRLDLAIYAQKDSDPATVLELIEPLVDTYIENSKNIQYMKEKFNKDSLCLFWPQKNKFSDSFDYKPLMIKITAVICDEDRPSLSFIRGLPVLSLRDLIWEYKRHAGYVEESFTQESLRVATDALVEILTRFENPNAGRSQSPRAAVSSPAPSDSLAPPPQAEAAQEPASEVVSDGIRKEVEGIEFVGQKKSSWCWAAASLMMRKFYLGENITLEDLVKETFGGKLLDRKHSLVLSRLRPEGKVEGRVLSWEEIKAAIDGNKPFVFGTSEHYCVCYGYEIRDSTGSLMVWDPLGQGSKSKKSYDQYRDVAQNGATAWKFDIVLRKGLIPLEVQNGPFNTMQEDFQLNVAVKTIAPPLNIQGAEFRVRMEKNIHGDPGAVIYTRKLDALPESVKWNGTVNKTHHASGRIRPEDRSLLVELELEFNDAEKRTLETANTQVIVAVQ